jgi:Copper transport outer membrane protein, MctB
VIDFKYHLVSIIAVFLALAVGLVVGATALSGPALALLQKAEKRVNRENSALFKTNTALQNQVKADQLFGGAAAPRLLPGLLADEKVVLVVAYNAAPAVQAGLTTALRQAGAQVTGTVTLNPQFLDTGGANEAQLKGLAQTLAQRTGVHLPTQLSSQVGGQQAVARVLAASLLTRVDPGLPSADSTAILSGLSQGNYITVSSGLTTPAQLAVLVTPGGPPSRNGSEVLVATAVALRNASNGTVMAGAVQSAGPNSVIGAEGTPPQVSTVDNADTELGQIMTVQALRQLVDRKPPEQFGIVPQAVPTPAPTPSVTPTTTPTPSTSAHTGGH